MGTKAPARPTLDALFTGEFVTDYEDLIEDELFLNRKWLAAHEAFGRVRNSFAGFEAFAFRPEPPGQFDTRAHARLMNEALCSLGDALGEVVLCWRRIEPNLNLMAMRAGDVLAHRPAGMALFARPDAPIEAPIDTPTLGPRVTDEDALIRDFGLNFFG